MKRIGKSVIYGLITVAIAFTIISTNIYPLPSWATVNLPTQTETATPRRLKITVNISEPDDLKVKEGEQKEID